MENPDKVGITYEFGGFSHVGPRPKNDDAWQVWRREGSLKAVIADGIGGAPYGEIYSKLACEYALRGLLDGCTPAEAIQYAQVETSDIRGIIDPAHGGGSTLLACTFAEDGTVRLSWVGDSRLALLRTDSTLEWINEPDRIPGTNALRSAICMPQTYIYSTETRMAPGDIAILMTDGVWEYYGENLAQTMDASDSTVNMAYFLTRQAGAEGHDNATVVVVRAADQQGSSEQEV